MTSRQFFVAPAATPPWQGLSPLSEDVFPKRCNCCGWHYPTLVHYFIDTVSVRPDHSGLKQDEDDDGRTIVLAFRGCQCGSTLLAPFRDRRDGSPAGILRRQQFAAAG